jgi:hypothetical protein
MRDVLDDTLEDGPTFTVSEVDGEIKISVRARVVFDSDRDAAESGHALGVFEGKLWISIEDARKVAVQRGAYGDATRRWCHLVDQLDFARESILGQYRSGTWRGSVFGRAVWI